MVFPHIKASKVPSLVLALASPLKEMSTYGYFEARTRVRREKFKLYKEAKQLSWQHTEYFKGIKRNSYIKTPVTEKLVDHYLRDLGAELQSEYEIQQQDLQKELDKLNGIYYDMLDGCAPFSPNNLLYYTDEDCEEWYDRAKRKAMSTMKVTCTCVPGTSAWKLWEKAINIVNLQKTILFSIDLEAYECNNDVITEIGISVYDPRENLERSVIPMIRTYHIIIDESFHLRNGRYVPDAKDDFLLGKSRHLHLRNAVIFVQSLINYYLIPHSPEEHSWTRAVVGHGISGDLEWLQSICLKIPENINIIDTYKLFEKMYSRGSTLTRLLKLCAIPHSNLHNGGNDAYFTLVLLLTMCDIGQRRLRKLDDLEHVRQAESEIHRKEKEQKKSRGSSHRGKKFH